MLIVDSWYTRPLVAISSAGINHEHNQFNFARPVSTGVWQIRECAWISGRTQTAPSNVNNIKLHPAHFLLAFNKTLTS